VADDGHPWGKTTAQLRGLSRCEESTNGGRSRRLAGDGLPQGLGKSSEKGEASTAERFYSSRGGEGCGGPAHRRQDADVELDRWYQARTGFLWSRMLMGGPRSGF
jgi:hypothetical protein